MISEKAPVYEQNESRWPNEIAAIINSLKRVSEPEHGHIEEVVFEHFASVDLGKRGSLSNTAAVKEIEAISRSLGARIWDRHKNESSSPCNGITAWHPC